MIPRDVSSDNPMNKYNLDLIHKTIELTETKTVLEDKCFELQSLNMEIIKQNKELIRRTIELTEAKAELEDKNVELMLSNKDIQKQKKELIRKTLELLETKSQLEDMNVELEKANKETLNMLKIKTEFINQAAHDLSTPLTPILILIPLLREQLHSDEAIHNLEVIERNVNYLYHIVNELVAIVKSQTSRFESIFENCNILSLINEVVSNNEVVFKSHRIRIVRRFDTNLPNVQIDKFKIMEVLQNLLSNAVEYTHGNGTITIGVHKIDNYIKVIIQDTGIGMSKKTLKRLFTEFFRADESRHARGVGLGLSICKRIIELHNGRILAESRGLGKGSSLIFELPIKQHKLSSKSS